MDREMLLVVLSCLCASCAGESVDRAADLGIQAEASIAEGGGAGDRGVPDAGVDGGGVAEAGPDGGGGSILRLSYTPVAACRLVDTRKTGGSFAKDEVRGYAVYGDDLSDQGGSAAGCALPAGIGEPRAVHVNVVAIGDEGRGNFAVYRHGATATSGTVNFDPDKGQPAIANAATIEVCPVDLSSCTEQLAVKLNYAASADLVLDVLGYYTEDTAADGHVDKALVYTPVEPCRVVDTRTAGGKLAADQVREYFVYGDKAAISAQGGDAQGCASPGGEPGAVHLRMVTVVEDSGSKGYVAALPANGDVEAVQSLVNYAYGYQHTGNTATVKTHHAGGAAGKDIKISNSKAGTTHVIIDVLGYYYPNDSDSSNPAGDYLYTPVSPCRVIDTRQTDDPFAADEADEYQVYGDDLSSQGGEAGGCASPGGEPRAAHLNFVAIPVTGQGHLRAFAADLAQAPPGSGAVNYKSGVQNIANAATVATDYDAAAGTAEIEVLNKNGAEVDLAVTVLGYYYEKPAASF